MNKILVTGADGVLGQAVMRHSIAYDCFAIPTNKETLDITNIEQCRKVIYAHKPDCVVHCAAYTNVDKAEQEMEACISVNRDGAMNVARVCEDIGAKFIYVSTDYVFSGKKGSLYETTDEPDPINTYGMSKCLGEHVAMNECSRTFIVRTSWVYGKGSTNFIPVMLKLLKQNKPLQVVGDQYGSPTYASDLAKLLLEMVHSERYGIYHGVNEGFCSRYELVLEMKKLMGLYCKVEPVDSSTFSTPAKRPTKCILSTDSLNGQFRKLPDWEDGLMRFLEDEDELL